MEVSSSLSELLGYFVMELKSRLDDGDHLLRNSSFEFLEMFYHEGRINCIQGVGFGEVNS
jgi:hypothetical protein